MNTQPGKLESLNVQWVLERIANGEQAKKIAQELGVSKQALSYQLKKQKDYPLAKEEFHDTKIESVHELLDEAVEARDFDLARAREAQLKRIEWRASVECPNRWGQKSHVTMDLTIDIGDRLRRARERTIEGAIEGVAQITHSDDVTP